MNELSLKRWVLYDSNDEGRAEEDMTVIKPSSSGRGVFNTCLILEKKRVF